MGVVASCSVLFVLAFAVDNIHAETINCPAGIDLERYPICEFQEEWNASEEFNSLVVQEVGKSADQINSDEVHTDSYGNEMTKSQYLLNSFADARAQVNAENPGLLEASERIKAEIYAAIGQ